MTWEPLTRAELDELISQGEAEMDGPQREFWRRIRIEPEKWAQSPWGDEGGGFWVVAVIGQRCIWYNDIEHGFNTSRFEKFGTIAEYWCNQDDLQWRVEILVNEFVRVLAPE